MYLSLLYCVDYNLQAKKKWRYLRSNVRSAFHHVPAGQLLAAAASSPSVADGKKVVDGRLGDEELLRTVRTCAILLIEASFWDPDTDSQRTLYKEWSLTVTFCGNAVFALARTDTYSDEVLRI